MRRYLVHGPQGNDVVDTYTNNLEEIARLAGYGYYDPFSVTVRELVWVTCEEGDLCENGEPAVSWTSDLEAASEFPSGVVGLFPSLHD